MFGGQGFVTLPWIIEIVGIDEAMPSSLAVRFME
jgi:hypothetical protein